MKRKGIFFGIDGATWQVVQPMMDEGKLPHLKRLVEAGVAAPLTTTHPGQTVPAWGVVHTGVNPGKLGLFHFLTNSHADYDEGKPSGTAYVRAKSIWHYLKEQGKKSIVLTTPLSYPATDFDGCMISPPGGQFGPNVVSSQPEGLLAELQEKLDFDISAVSVQKRQIESQKRRNISSGKKLAREMRLQQMYDFNTYVIEKLGRCIHYLMDNKEWEFLMIVFSSTDTIQHHFWHYRDKQHPCYDPELAEKFGDVVEDIHMQVDKILGEVMDKVGDAYPIMTMADHGFGPMHKHFFANKWLEEKNLLKIEPEKLTQKVVKRYPLRDLLMFANLGVLSRILPGRITSKSIPLKRSIPRPISEGIDWSTTQAYATSFAININLKGREPQGIVEPVDYDTLVAQIKEDLMNLTDPDTGEKIVAGAWEKNELYSGDYVEEAPDIIYIFKEATYFMKKELTSDAVIQPIAQDDFLTAHHVGSLVGLRDGLFAAYGQGIVQGKRLPNAEITDLAPTMMHLMGYAVPEAVDGKVMEEILTEEFLQEHPVAFQQGDHVLEGTSASAELTPEEEAKVMQSLRDLGYLG